MARKSKKHRTLVSYKKNYVYCAMIVRTGLFKLSLQGFF